MKLLEQKVTSSSAQLYQPSSAFTQTQYGRVHDVRKKVLLDSTKIGYGLDKYHAMIYVAPSSTDLSEHLRQLSPCYEKEITKAGYEEICSSVALLFGDFAGEITELVEPEHTIIRLPEADIEWEKIHARMIRLCRKYA